MFKFLRKILYLLLFFVFCYIFIFLNLGKFLNVTKEPVNSDVIVSLGGGDLERIKKAIELYKNGYALQNLLILTGNQPLSKKDPRIEYINKNNLKNINIINIENTKNTKEEVIYIKNFLINNNYKSAILVSDPPHSRRISTLINLLKINNDDNLTFNLVATDSKWWSNNTYYENKKGRKFAFLEAIKLSYAYLAYGALEKIGILNSFEDNYLIKDIRKDIIRKYN